MNTASDHTIVAQWTPNTYHIHYFLGNGTATAGVTEIGTAQEVTYGSPVTLTAFVNLGATFPLSGNGWSFAGWSTSQTGTDRNYTDGQNIANYNSTQDLNLYAVGVRTLNFSSGISPTTHQSLSQYWNPYSASSSRVTPVTVPTATSISGWTFMGYETTASDLTNHTDVASTEVGTAQSFEPTRFTVLNFFAKYSRQLTINYNANGGTGTTTATTATQIYNSGYGDNGANSGAGISTPSFTLANNTFTRPGYAFVEWAEESASGARHVAGSTYDTWTPAVDSSETTKTMYAIWRDVQPPTVSCPNVMYPDDAVITLQDAGSGIRYFAVTTSETAPTQTGNVDVISGDQLNYWYQVENTTDEISVNFANLAVGDYYAWGKDAAGNTTHVAFSVEKAQLAIPALAEVTYTYNGLEQTVAIINLDLRYMTISGETSINAGEKQAVISIIDKDNYTWTDDSTRDITITWNIVPKSIESNNITAEIEEEYHEYTGHAIRPEVTVIDTDILEEVSGEIQYDVLAENGDYRLTYTDNQNVGEARITIEGIGNYTGSRTITFYIVSIGLMEPTIEGEYIYTGDEIIATLQNFEASMMDVSGDVRVNAGTTDIIVSLKDKNSYTWQGGGTEDVVIPWTIQPRSLTSEGIAVTLTPDRYEYTGSARTPEPVVTDGQRTLTKDVDYGLSYANNTDVGIAEITITGIGNYKDAITTQFNIAEKVLTRPSIVGTYPYTGQEQTAILNENYLPALMTVENNKRTEVGSQFVKVSLNDTNNYIWDNGVKGDLYIKWTISGANIEDGNLEVTLNQDVFPYTGSEIKPIATVTYLGTLLRETIDYEVSYEDNINVGTGHVVITGKGSYAGVVRKNFTITNAKLVLAANSKTKQYDGTPLTDDTISIVEGALSPGHYYEATVEGSITEVGSVDNIITNVVIKDERDTDVTDQYEITLQNGILTVTQAESQIIFTPSELRVVAGNKIGGTYSSNSNNTVILTISDPSIASVTYSNGTFELTGLKEGTTKIIATVPETFNQLGARVEVNVTVLRANYSVTKNDNTTYYYTLADAVQEDGVVVSNGTFVDTSESVVIDHNIRLVLTPGTVTFENKAIRVSGTGTLTVVGEEGSKLRNNGEVAIINNGFVRIGDEVGELINSPMVEADKYAITGNFAFDGGTLRGSEYPPYSSYGQTIRPYGDIETKKVGDKYESTVVIEKVPPVIKVEQNTIVPTNEDVVLTVKITDNLSGVKEASYTLGGTTHSLSLDTYGVGTITVSENQVVTIQAKDWAGNVGTLEHEVTNIDKIAENVTRTEVVDEVDGVVKNTLVLLRNIKTTDDEEVTSVFVSNTNTRPAENAEGWSSFNKDMVIPWKLDNSTGNGEKHIYIWAKDLAGNISEAPYDITLTLDTRLIGGSTNYFDFTFVGYDRNLVAETSLLQKANVHLKIDNSNVDSSKVQLERTNDNYEYKGMKAILYKAKLTNVSGVGKVLITIDSGTLKDRAGNVNVEQTLTTDYVVDTNVPNITINGDVISISDAEGNLAAVTVNGVFRSTNGQNIGEVKTGDKITAYDKAGNMATRTK